MNLICGISSIAVAAQATIQAAISQTAAHNGFVLALILLLIAAIADGADGYIARRFKGGELGEQLDSLADAVSFGVAPALLIYLQFGQINPLVGDPDPLVAVFPIFYAICGVLRLARFNSMASSKTGFEGLPITAGCVMLVTYMLLSKEKYCQDRLPSSTYPLSIYSYGEFGKLSEDQERQDSSFCSFHFWYNYASLSVQYRIYANTSQSCLLS